MKSFSDLPAISVSKTFVKQPQHVMPLLTHAHTNWARWPVAFILQLGKKPTHTYFLSFASNPGIENVMIDGNGSFINNKETTETKNQTEKKIGLRTKTKSKRFQTNFQIL